MYRVLLVDDEPLILSGIKFMIDWEGENCKIVGTATNGKLALEAIDALQPDIVVADINMPVMDGIQLLEKAQEKHPAVVFIMLTNLEDFYLVQDALRLRAVDYLVKTNLETESLTSSVRHAKAEVDKRTQYVQASIVEDYLKADRIEILTSAVKRFISGSEINNQVLEVLEEESFLTHYGVIYLTITEYPGEPSTEDYQRWMGWLAEAVGELAGRSFYHHLLLEEDTHNITLVHWGSTAHEFTKGAPVFVERLSSISNTILGLSPTVLLTEVFTGEEQRHEVQQQRRELKDFLYLTGKQTIFYQEIGTEEYQPLLLQGISGKLQGSLNSGSLSGSLQIIDEVIEQVETIPHRKTDILWVCEQLYQTVSEQLDGAVEKENYFAQKEEVAEELARISTRGQVVHFLETLRNETEANFEPSSPGRLDVLERAREYVNDNVHKRISLQEVAEYARISPNYLSSLFKKEYHQNFVDYVNSTKMEKAKEYLKEDKYRINEISYMLGFENAYYFSRVFRKHVGMPPTEYAKEQLEEF